MAKLFAWLVAQFETYSITTSRKTYLQYILAIAARRPFKLSGERRQTEVGFVPSVVMVARVASVNAEASPTVFVIEMVEKG